MIITLTFALIGAVTYFFRSALIMGGSARREGRLDGAMSFVGPAALAGLVAGSLFVDGTDVTAGAPAEVVAVVAAMAAVHRTKNPTWALAVGLPVFWIGSALGLGHVVAV